MAKQGNQGVPARPNAAPEILAAIRRLHLPTAGQVPFVPRKNWRPSQPMPRGPQNGFIDRQGREWVKGPSRTSGEAFEWDVQLFDGTHLNVSLTGTITH